VVSPNESELREIVALKNVLIQAQQDELDRVKGEMARGSSVYVLMSKGQREEWERMKGVEEAFRLVEKLREVVPSNVKWVDKNVHKVIKNVVRLKEAERAAGLGCNLMILGKDGGMDVFQKQIDGIKADKEVIDKIVKEIQAVCRNQDKESEIVKHNALIGKQLLNQFAVILALINDHCQTTFNLYDLNFTTQEDLIRTKIQLTSLEDEKMTLKSQLNKNASELTSLYDQLTLLKSKNSRLSQKICLLQRFLKSKPALMQNYLTFS